MRGTRQTCTSFARQIAAAIHRLLLASVAFGGTSLSGCGGSSEPESAPQSLELHDVSPLELQIDKRRFASASTATGEGSPRTILVRASGTSANGVGPVMQLRVNGVNMGSVTVNSTSASDYRFNVPTIMPPETKIDLVFANDAVSQDRSLTVQSMTVDGVLYPANSPDVVYDIGAGNAAFDGKDVHPGQSVMPSSGALRFVVNTPNVRCTGDGKVDDRDCLNKAINSGASNFVIFPKGKVYRVSGPLSVSPGKHLFGQGSKILTDGSNSVAVLDLTNTRDVIIEGFKLDYQSSYKNYFGPIHIGKGSTNIEISSNLLTGGTYGSERTAAAGIYIEGEFISDLKVLGNEISGTRYGVLVEASGVAKDAPASQFPKRLKISGNKIVDASSDAIEINSPVQGLGRDQGESVSDVEISNNQLSTPAALSQTSGFCIGIAGVARATITGNQLSKCKWAGIHIEDAANDILVSKNVIDGVLGGGLQDQSNYSGVQILSLANHIQVIDNTIQNTAGDAILLSWNGKNWYTHHIVVQRNTIRNAGRYSVVAGALASQPMYSDISSNMAIGAKKRTADNISFYVDKSSTEIVVRDNTDVMQ